VITAGAIDTVAMTFGSTAVARFATEPPEARGLARDEVRLLVAQPDRLQHARFHDIARFLEPGDLLVVNTSATLPAAVDGKLGDRPVVVHFSTAKDDGTWVVELRQPDSSGPLLDAAAGDRVDLPGGARITLVAAHPDASQRTAIRLWRSIVVAADSVEDYLRRRGRPITYDYLRGRWPLSAYQPVFAREPGSAEMPSAARPFTDSLVTELVTSGIAVAPVLLHAGVSSLEAGEAPQAERFRVSATTARLVNDTRRAGGRIVAVGTTVTRALETVASADGEVSAGQGWTDLVLGPDRPARVVGGLITGWHEPDSSHLFVLEAVAGRRLVRDAYQAALESGYLWHEFGDSCLLLPAL
jgi:S-adenosylmethionine:tRNA ribosyltransferase-isomerase